ncbi:MAG: acyl-CoA dehydrogenase family protein [Candidatus Thermoplasmatota archaeon]|jgi:isovaleryl-CoA dehydrogenase|nr:acyl-CoA dehydrogenase family protein [Candidatus Thermoplasmatota archaeon]MCL5800908.1 acyl-CoA dehydrogenase family protein [Candidatus Thermoplasmatota archaeon]
MQPVYNETHMELRETVREFVKRKIQPIASRIDTEDYFPEEIFKEMGRLGLLGITVPEEYGGSGMDYAAQALVEEELGYVSPPLALSYGAHSNLCLDSLYRNGSIQQREEYVPKLCSGEWIGSLALTEPSSGSDALAMKTEAVRDGDGFLLNGSKTLITNAPYSDLFFVYARTGKEYTPFVVLSGDKGFSRGSKFSKMGMRGSPTGELFFDSIHLTRDRIIGKENDGKNVILNGLNSERVILSFIFLGLARRALELSVSYASERKQGGQTIDRYELVQEKLAYMYSRYRASRFLCEDALAKLKGSSKDGLSAATGILYTAESAEYIAREAVQIHGGYGYLRDFEVERLLRDAILGQIGAGTTEIRKHIVARELSKSFLHSGKIPE